MTVQTKAGAGAGAHPPMVSIENGDSEEPIPHMDETKLNKKGD